MRTLYRASRVHTLSPLAGGEWLLIDGRHVERVGAGDPPGADRTVELPGTTILPGFIDAHVHLTGTGLAMEGLDLAGAESREAMVAAVRGHVAARPGPVLGVGFDESRWPDPSFPSLAEMDDVSRESLILVRTDGYLSLANTTALEDSGVLAAEGVDRSPEGKPTGLLRGPANSDIQRWYFESLPTSAIQDYQLRTATLAVSRGVTSLHEMSIPDKRGRRDLEVLVGHRAALPVDLAIYVAERDIPYVMDFGFHAIGGDLFLDGSIGARTAAVEDPYTDDEGTASLVYGDDELAEFLHNAHLAGMQVGLHAIGDTAIEQAVGVWERVYRALDSRGRRHFRARRHRLEHFEMASTDHVERAAALGLAISIQPAFDSAWGGEDGMYARRLGPERARRMNPFRTLIERGMEVGAGSDTPVTPLDPMLGVWALENHHNASQRLSREQAVRIFTIGSARLGHQLKKGRLEPGAAADFAAYEADPLDVPDPRDLRPVLTVSRGRDVYAR
jgi:predicted amidohydrolase YtcJ